MSPSFGAAYCGRGKRIVVQGELTKLLYEVNRVATTRVSAGHVYGLELERGEPGGFCETATGMLEVGLFELSSGNSSNPSNPLFVVG